MVKLITVCLATYNGAAFLPEQLASLQSQDDPAFQVFAQDDGSTDASAWYVSRTCAEDLRFLPGAESGRHLGPAGNFLSLLQQCDSPYVALCDQDDLWLPHRLSRCRKAMNDLERTFGQSTPLLVHSDCSLMDEHGGEIYPSFFRHQGWDSRAVTLPPLLVQNNVTGCTLMMNAALCRLVAERARPEEMFMHDWTIALTAAACGRIAFIDEPLVRYRQHAGNALGASEETQIRRGLQALAHMDRARARIQLSYTHAEGFLRMMGDVLAPDARRTVEDFLITRDMPKLKRLNALRCGGFLMQSRITRAGQMLFG